MLIIPEIQLQDGKVVTRSAVAENPYIHDIEPMEALRKFVSGGAQMIQVVDVDAASGHATHNEALIRQMIDESISAKDA